VIAIYDRFTSRRAQLFSGCDSKFQELHPISRQYPERPILGIGALIFDADRILLAERGRDPLKGYWSLPGGVLETGESLEEGIRREVREETGLIVETEGIAEVFERIIRDAQGRAEYHYVLIDYFCRVAGGVECAGDDCSAIEWFRIEQLPGLRLTEGTLVVIRNAHEKYQRRSAGV
jgi:8-oxo-dGTP diphosphatase